MRSACWALLGVLSATAAGVGGPARLPSRGRPTPGSLSRPVRAPQPSHTSRLEDSRLGGMGLASGEGAAIRVQLEALGVDVDAALAAAPRLADLDSRDLQASLAFVAKYVGDARLVPFICAHPESLLWSDHAIERLLRNELGLEAEALARLLAEAPFLLGPGTAARAAHVVAFLQEDLALTVEESRGVVLAFPRVLTLHVNSAVGERGGPSSRPPLEIVLALPALAALHAAGTAEPAEPAGARTSGLRERVAFLETAARLSAAAKPSSAMRQVLARAVCRHPQLLGLDVCAKLRPTVAFYADAGVDVRRLLALHPHALSLSVLANVAPKLRFWEAAGVPDVGAMLSAHPVLVSLSLDANLRPKTEYLARLLPAPGVLGRALQAYPQVYSLSLGGNIVPTVSFLNLTGYDVRAQLRLRHLGASLARRIVPRHELWRRRRGALCGWRPSVADVCVLSDAGYCRRLGVSVAELVAIEAAVGPVVRELAKVDPSALARAFGADDDDDDDSEGGCAAAEPRGAEGGAGGVVAPAGAVAMPRTKVPRASRARTPAQPDADGAAGSATQR